MRELKQIAEEKAKDNDIDNLEFIKLIQAEVDTIQRIRNSREAFYNEP